MDEEQARSLKGVKTNSKASYRDLSCRFCDTGTQESQEHLQTCGGCQFERMNLDMGNGKWPVIVWRKMKDKFGHKLGHFYGVFGNKVIPHDGVLGQTKKTVISDF